MNKKTKIIFVFGTLGLLLIFAGPVFAQVATNTNTINSCPAANPSGALRCPTGQYFIGNTCRTDSQSNFTSCTNSDRNENFNCTNNSCVCEPSFPIDCRSAGIAGYQKCLNSGTLPPVACNNDPYSQVVQCTGACGSCQSGFERINGTGNCVALCPAGTSRISNGTCLSLESVSNRVGDLENLELCHFDVRGNYVNDSEQACPETFDPASLSGQVATIRISLEGLAQLFSSIIPSAEITEIINNLIAGNVTNLITNITNILNEDPVPVRLATFVELSSAELNGDRDGYLNANNLCSAAAADSHICTAEEIMNTYVSDAEAIANISEIVWINAGSPANTFPAVNDCGGWERNINPYYGTVWNFNLDSAGIQPCFATKKFACCK